MSFEAWESFSDRVSQPIAAVEYEPMGVIHEFDDVVWPAHDDYETWRLFKEADLAFGSQALTAFGKKPVCRFSTDP